MNSKAYADVAPSQITTSDKKTPTNKPRESVNAKNDTKHDKEVEDEV